MLGDRNAKSALAHAEELLKTSPRLAGHAPPAGSSAIFPAEALPDR
jgi:hypothetical protein